MRTRRPGSAADGLGRPHPPWAGARAGLHFHCAFRFILFVPMTRAHARLLGPCFKTGPESTQSYSVADGRVTGSARDDRGHSRAVAAPALGPTYAIASELAAGRARTCRGPAPTCLPSSVTVGIPPVRELRRTEHTGCTADLRPSPNGSRRPTREEVHAFRDRSAGRRRGHAGACRRATTAPGLRRRG